MAITPGSVTPDSTTPPAATPAPAATAPATPAAPAQAPAAASAPAQAPAQTTPTPSSPTTQSGMPGIPTDATAVATAHPTSVLRGALMGILGAAAKVGKGVGNELKTINAGGHVAQENTRIAQQGEIQRQQQQAQAAKDAQRAAEDTHIKSGYENSETIARTNVSASLATGQAIKNSTDQAAYNQTQRENNDKNNAADAEWIQALRDEGVPFKEDHGKSFDNLGPADAKDIVSGIYAPISNGQTGADHGIVLLPVDVAKKTPLTKDRQTVVDWKVDPNTGAKTPVYQTFQAGTDTVFTAHEGYMVGQKKSAEADKLSEAIQKQKLNQADIAAKGAEANKSNAEAANQRAQAAMFGAGVTPQNMNLTGDEFVKTLPAQMQGIVDSMHHYNLAPKDLPRGKEKLPFMAALTHAYPDWSEPKYEERYNYLKEYGSSTKGDGATRNRLNTAIGHMDALSQASDALGRNDVPALTALANKLGVAVGRTPKITYDAIALKAAGESAGAIKGGAAAATDAEIENTYKSFNGDAGAAQRQANIDAQYGILNTQVNTIRDGFTNKMGVTPEQFGQPVLYGNTQEVLNRHLGGGNAAPLQNLQQNAQGQQIGWNGTQWVDAKTRQPYSAPGGHK